MNRHLSRLEYLEKLDIYVNPSIAYAFMNKIKPEDIIFDITIESITIDNLMSLNTNKYKDRIKVDDLNEFLSIIN